MKHSVSDVIEKYELGGELTHGCMNFDKMLTRIETDRIGAIFEDGFNKFKELPVIQSIEEFMEDNNQPQEHPNLMANRLEFKQKWIIKNVDECRHMDFEDLNEEELEEIQNQMNIMTKAQKSHFRLDLFKEKNNTFKHYARWIERKDRLTIQYERINNQFKQDKKDMIHEKASADVKIKEFETLLSKFFSDNVILKLRPILKMGNFKEAVEELKSIIHEGSAVQLMHLRGILEHTVYERNLNFKVFNIIIQLIYTMLEEFGSIRSREEKILDLSKMLEKAMLLK
jgi:hypothetical protein